MYKIQACDRICKKRCFLFFYTITRFFINFIQNKKNILFKGAFSFKSEKVPRAFLTSLKKSKVNQFFLTLSFFRHCEGCNSATTIPIKMSTPPNKAKGDKRSPAKRPTMPAHTGSPA